MWTCQTPAAKRDTVPPSSGLKRCLPHSLCPPGLREPDCARPLSGQHGQVRGRGDYRTTQYTPGDCTPHSYGYTSNYTTPCSTHPVNSTPHPVKQNGQVASSTSPLYPVTSSPELPQADCCHCHLSASMINNCHTYYGLRKDQVVFSGGGDHQGADHYYPPVPKIAEEGSPLVQGDCRFTTLPSQHTTALDTSYSRHTRTGDMFQGHLSQVKFPGSSVHVLPSDCESTGSDQDSNGSREHVVCVPGMVGRGSQVTPPVEGRYSPPGLVQCADDILNRCAANSHSFSRKKQ